MENRNDRMYGSERYSAVSGPWSLDKGCPGTSCMTLSMSLNVSVFQFPFLQNRVNNMSNQKCDD